MEIKGTVTHVGDVETGQTRNGKDWQKQGFAVKFKDGSYEKEAWFTLFGRAVASCPVEGDEVNVHFNVSSREYNGRWYTELGAWKVEVMDTQTSGNGKELPF